MNIHDEHTCKTAFSAGLPNRQLRKAYRLELKGRHTRQRFRFKTSISLSQTKRIREGKQNGGVFFGAGELCFCFICFVGIIGGCTKHLLQTQNARRHTEHRLQKGQTLNSGRHTKHRGPQKREFWRAY